jgi:hypothetical protein
MNEVMFDILKKKKILVQMLEIKQIKLSYNYDVCSTYYFMQENLKINNVASVV